MTSSVEAACRAVDRAVAHWQAGDLDAALACCHEALRLDPAQVDALAHAGTIAWSRGDADEAMRLYLRAHAAAPRHVGVLLNIATLHHETDDLDTSLHWIAEAAAVLPHHPEVVWRRSLVELALGDYASGWAHYEAGLLQASSRGPGPGFTTPSWDGAPCDRLLLWHEQGLGDTIQFVRYARLCRTRAKRVVVLCPAELTALLRSCPHVDDAVDTIAADDFDEHVAMMSLPHRFGTTVETIPDAIPYLFADDALARRRAVRMKDDRFKVGLVWAGNVRTDQPRFRGIDRRRSMSLATMAPLLALDRIAFFSLQKGPASDEARDARIVDPMTDVGTFAETAAIVANLDLVIAVDTAVAHLAGAMGKPVWVLSRRDACWRWLRNRPTSPWYPSACVFGQTTSGTWDAVIARVRDELATMPR